MNIESQILHNQTEMLKEMGEIKQDIGRISGTLSRLIPQVNGLEDRQNSFITKKSFRLLIIILAGIFSTIISTKLLGAW